MNFETLHQENHESNESLKPRFATRTVLFDQDGRVAIINAKKHGYYKIHTAISTIEDNVVTEPGMSTMQDRDLNFLKLTREKLNPES